MKYRFKMNHLHWSGAQQCQKVATRYFAALSPAFPVNRICLLAAENIERLVSTVRSSYASAVLGIVILSVRLSHACFVTKLQNILPIF